MSWLGSSLPINYLICPCRSLFTPYFKYLLEGAVQYLLEDDPLVGSKQKKKKAKLDVQVEQKDNLFGLKLWNLRALILKSLHKCFLYDNEQKILDASNFQVSWLILNSACASLPQPACFCKTLVKSAGQLAFHVLL